MPRLVIDTIGSNYPHVRGIAALKFGYLNGSESAWPAAAIAEQQHRGQLVALIDVLGTEPQKAAIIDWEHGDVQDPQRLAWWVRERNAFRGDAVVYTNKDSMPAVISALHGAGEYYQLWVADLTSNGQPPAKAPDFGLPPNVALLGVQYAWPQHSGGPFDLSLLFNDHWHANEHAAAHLIAATAGVEGQAVEGHAVEEPTYEARADEARANQGDEPEAVAAAADPKDETPDGPTSSAPPWETAPYPMPTADHSGPPPGTALQLQGQWDATGPGAVVTGGAFLPAPTEPRPYVTRAADLSGTAATTAAAVAAGINHAGLQRWISDGALVVKDLHTAGASHVAGVLEQALGGVLEVGRLLAAIGT